MMTMNSVGLMVISGFCIIFTLFFIFLLKFLKKACTLLVVQNKLTANLYSSWSGIETTELLSDAGIEIPEPEIDDEGPLY